MTRHPCILFFVVLLSSTVFAQDLPMSQMEALLDLRAFWNISDWNTLQHPCAWIGVDCFFEPLIDGEARRRQLSTGGPSNLHNNTVLGITITGEMVNIQNATFSWSLLLPFTSLRALTITNVSIHGTLPTAFDLGRDFRKLHIQATNMSGTIPTQIGSWTSLHHLILSNNQLTGTIPTEILLLHDLQTLLLASNQLSGPLPSLFELTFLTRALTNCSVVNNHNLSCPSTLIRPPFLCECENTSTATTTSPSSATTSQAPAPTIGFERILPDDADESMSTAEIVGISVGGVVLILCVVGIVIVVQIFRNRLRPKQSSVESEVAQGTQASKDPEQDIYSQNIPDDAHWQTVDYGNVAPFVFDTSESQKVIASSNTSSTTAPKKLLQIKPEELEFGRLIGEGSFGQVWLGKWRRSPAAIKQVKSDVVNQAVIDDFFRESMLVSSIRPHANIVQLFGVCLAPLCVVLECLPRGSLRSYLDDSANEIDMDQMMRWARDIATGMLHLSLEGIVHRDLAARNVLLTDDLQAKISDFGMSRKIDHDNAYYTKTSVGPLKWMSPEAVKHNIFSEKSDVWSYGVTMIEVLSRQKPYPKMNAAQVAAQVSNNQLRPDVPSSCTNESMVKVLNACFQFDADTRVTFKDINSMLH